MLKADLRGTRSAILKKLGESASSVLPIIVIVSFLCLLVTPVPTDLMLAFFIGSLLVILGMGLFSLGADTAMTPIGSKIGSALTKSRSVMLMLAVGLVLGTAITVSEPDLQVLAETVPHINSTVLIVTVGVGVGLFLVICMVRIITGIRLRLLLITCYAAVFILAALSEKEFLSVAFDAGGVTTGPMTVPFILALGIGISNMRSDHEAESDSFGLVALCSIGPIIAVLVLGFFYTGGGSFTGIDVFSFSNTTEIGWAYIKALSEFMIKMGIALAPIAVIFLLFQIFSLRLSGRNFAKICMGIIYTYIGLVLFLTGVNVGFSSLGSVLAAKLAGDGMRYLLIPLSMLLGWFIISAEPAVSVLEHQIEEVSSGAIPGKAVKLSLSVAISLAMGISMLRVLTGIPLLWFVVPGYAIALILSFFVPDMYTAIAFDSGGVASGPMTATFMLQFMIGASTAVGGNVLTDAFGLVAMVAMMPLISVQVMGFVYSRAGVEKRQESVFGDYDIIELWG